MWQQIVDRVAIESDLTTAWRRTRELTPFSPSWDAAMGGIEDLERELWLLDPVSHSVREVRAEAPAVAQLALGHR
jgi:hypothetical protein